ncbi:hypothetical protein BKA70DRAFT_1330354 [Coprinopsis sp. MPI-PUGE-AT-0042]|nr:hypothetical protein BKA70DRAFT_1330354 [Coprinopsis sp. MPI-PUGE-AT-0042]
MRWRLYDTEREIPPRKVATCGHTAKFIGVPRHSQHVDQGMSSLPSARTAWQTNGTKFLAPKPNLVVPWNRVIGFPTAIIWWGLRQKV